MEKYVSKSINAQRLLTLGDLDIRRLAVADPSLTADEYFSKVERFVEKAPQYADSLSRASDASELKEIGDALKVIGYDKLAPAIEGICDAIAVGQRQLAERWASEAVSEFNTLFSRTKSAYTKRRFKASRTPEDAENPESGVLLWEALNYFDYEEKHRKLRILAVDDVAVVLNTLTSVLGKHYEVFALTKASLVEGFLMHTTPELFLLDIEMPDMNGYDLVHVIRGFEKHRDTPIIFLTGNASMENLRTAISIGACDFITKPINPDILLEKIESKIVWKRAF